MTGGCNEQRQCFAQRDRTSGVQIDIRGRYLWHSVRVSLLGFCAHIGFGGNRHIRFFGYALLLIPLIIPWLGKRYITIPEWARWSLGRRGGRKPNHSSNWRGCTLSHSSAVFYDRQREHLRCTGMEADSRVCGAPFCAGCLYNSFPRLYLYAALLIAV